MLVGACHIHHIVAQQSLPAADGVAGDSSVSVPQMRSVIHIENRRGEIKPRHVRILTAGDRQGIDPALRDSVGIGDSLGGF